MKRICLLLISATCSWSAANESPGEAAISFLEQVREGNISLHGRSPEGDRLLDLDRGVVTEGAAVGAEVAVPALPDACNAWESNSEPANSWLAESASKAIWPQP